MSTSARSPASLALVLIVSAKPSIAAWQSNGNPLCTAPLRQAQAVAVSDGGAGAIVVWIDYRLNEFHGGLFYSDIYAQHIDGNGVPQWAINGVPICTADFDQYGIDVIPDGSGGAVLAWVDDRNGASDIYAQHLSFQGTSLWTTNGAPVCTFSMNQVSPRLSSDGEGGVIITWGDQRPVNSHDIYVQRLDQSGTALWSTNGIPICTAVRSQAGPQVVASTGGAFVIVWKDGRPDVSSEIDDIYAQLVDPSGLVAWTADGVPVCTAANKQELPVAVPDAAGGTLVAWIDWRSGASPAAVYAQKISLSGVTQWASNGVTLGLPALAGQQAPAIVADGAGGAFIAAGDYAQSVRVQLVNAAGSSPWGSPLLLSSSGYEPRIVSDGSGGAVVAWTDYRNSSSSNPSDIYAQRFDATGTSQWLSVGSAVSLADSVQEAPAIVSTNDGGAIIAWYDGRTDALGDVYASRLGPLGTTPTGVHDHATPAALRLSESFPNPFSRNTSMTLSIDRDAYVARDVFDVRGSRVAHFAPAAYPTGEHTLVFDGRDVAGRLLPSGVYFYRVKIGDQATTRKLIISR